MNKQRISRYLLLISITTFLSIFFYIVQTSYAKLVKPTRDAESNELLKPINTQLNTQVFEEIEKRRYIETENLNFQVTPTDVQITITP